MLQSAITKAQLENPSEQPVEDSEGEEANPKVNPKSSLLTQALTSTLRSSQSPQLTEDQQDPPSEEPHCPIFLDVEENPPRKNEQERLRQFQWRTKPTMSQAGFETRREEKKARKNLPACTGDCNVY